MNAHLQNLVDSLEDCIDATDYVRVIRKIARRRDPDGIAVLASLLDTPGSVGAAAVRALVSFGLFAESEMRRLLVESVDEDQIRNAHRVLARLGDRRSQRAQYAHCWADFEADEARRAEEACVPIPRATACAGR